LLLSVILLGVGLSLVGVDTLGVATGLVVGDEVVRWMRGVPAGGGLRFRTSTEKDRKCIIVHKSYIQLH